MDLQTMIEQAYAWAAGVKAGTIQVGRCATQREEIRTMLQAGARSCEIERSIGAARQTISKVRKSMAASA
jgi:uncharacterized protein YerC